MLRGGSCLGGRVAAAQLSYTTPQLCVSPPIAGARRRLKKQALQLWRDDCALLFHAGIEQKLRTMMHGMQEDDTPPAMLLFTELVSS